MKIIDLTLPIYTGMPVYPGDLEASIEIIQTVATHGWNMRRIQINTHDGTHVNMPVHAMDGGKNLDDYALEDFCGQTKIYTSPQDISSDLGVIFRDQNIDNEIAELIKARHPRFIGLSSVYEFDIEMERDLLKAGIISFERLTNLQELPLSFQFYGIPLKIREGDGSPVRAFAVIP